MDATGDWFYPVVMKGKSLSCVFDASVPSAMLTDS
jgi:hypothetical protein